MAKKQKTQSTNPLTIEEAHKISHDLLPKVSRSFALAIKALPEPVCSYICTSYLLCRIVDTIEDHPTLENKTKYFDQFDKNLHSVEKWESLNFDLLVGMNPPQSWDHDLALQSKAVFRLMASFPEAIREILKKNVYEMSQGMRDYTARGGESAIEIIDASDLDKYCYYVAGTVGNLLTEVFAEYCGIKDPKWIEAQKERGYHFAQGLQKVNIIKDVAADFKRGSVFLPQRWLERFGLTREDLIQGNAKPQTKSLLLYFVQHAADHLEKARDYILNIPSNQKGIRLFCIWPYAMALDTLNLGLQKDRLFTSDHVIKVSRPQMYRMMAMTKAVAPYTLPLKVYLNAKIKSLRAAEGASLRESAAEGRV